ncbi:MAG: hypothetical protein AAFO79_07775, partial [Pseudomonadota bacterium]
MRHYQIEMLGWLDLSDRLTVSLQRAFAAADRAEQTEVVAEHVLSAFLEDVEARDYFARQRADVAGIKRHCVGQVTPAGLATTEAVGPALQAHLSAAASAPTRALQPQPQQMPQARVPMGTNGLGGGFSSNTSFGSGQSASAGQPQREEPRYGAAPLVGR